MAKKNTSTRKPTESTSDAEAVVVTELNDAAEPMNNATASDETPPSKGKAKAKEETPVSTSVGIADIRKAVAFSNSVGGLDNALALLQILKVAKEVQ